MSQENYNLQKRHQLSMVDHQEHGPVDSFFHG